MRLKIRHDTVYHYAEAARSALHILRLTPRNADSQFVKRWRIEIDGDARLDRGEDAFGNITHTVYVEGPLEKLRLTVDGEVDTADTLGIIRGTAERLPSAFYLRETALTRPSAEIQAFAADCLAAEAGDRLAAMHRMMARLNAGMEITLDPPTFEGRTAETFRTQKGSNHDAAHVLIAAARSVAIPARFVTGYRFAADKGPRAAPHAWMEAMVERIGWVGFDVEACICATDRYVRVAAGPDLLDAAPIRGAAHGGVIEKQDVAVSIEQGRQIVEA